MPPTDLPAAAPAPEPAFAVPAAGEIDRLWRLLHARGEAIAAMAALAREPMSGELAEFAQAVKRSGPERIAFAVQSLEDLLAITAPGLAALECIAARGQDTTASALALWREFHAARSTLLELAFSRG